MKAIYSALLAASILSAPAAETSFDAALEVLLKDSVQAVNEAKRQKIAVLDFSDLNGNTSLFGKFLAEQVSIGLVTSKKEFVVVDRANLRSIMAEHKLTEDGLVQPENARKLGEFSGVDALVIGTATDVPSGYLVTMKVISTDKAEICAAVRGRLPKSPDFDAQATAPEPATAAPKMDDKTRPETKLDIGKDFVGKHLRVSMSKVQILKSGEVSVALSFYRSDEAGDIEVVPRIHAQTPTYYYPDELMQHAAKVNTLVCSDGSEFELTNVTGLEFRKDEGSDFPSLSEKRPLAVTYRFKPAEGRFPAIPKGETLTLNAAVEVYTRAPGGRGNYNNAGVVNVNISEIR